MDGRIAELNRRSRALGTLIFGSRQANQIIEGVDWHGEPDFLASLSLTGGALPGSAQQRNALILPQATAERLRVEVGDQVLARVATVTGQQNVGEFVLAATIENSGFAAFSSAFVRLDYLGELIGTGAGEFQLLHLYLRRSAAGRSRGGGVARPGCRPRPRRSAARKPTVVRRRGRSGPGRARSAAE